MVAVYYLDTSALVKQYVDEAGSAWLRHLIASGSIVPWFRLTNPA